MHEHPACDVCSRTLLKGEELHEYVTPQGERFGVCVLCRSRAEESGWIPAEQWGTTAHEPPSRGGRGAALRKRLEGIATRAREGGRGRRSARKDDPPPPDADPAPGLPSDPVSETPAGVEPTPVAEPEPAAAAEHGPVAALEESPSTAEQVAPDPTAARRPNPARARPARPQAKRRSKGASAGASPQTRHTPQPRRGPEAIMRTAVDRFNSSEEPRKVAGLIRSLGEPQAAVRPDPRRQLALVTVAWELSWYQWEVSANGDDESVREVAKGKEVSELTEEARAWNAAVAEDGSLELRARRRKASAREA